MYEWSQRIAQGVVQDEIELAPLITDAFLRGGKDRKELYIQARGGILGAFNPADSLVIFPLLLQSIVAAAPAIYALLTSGAINNVLSLVKDALSAKEHLQQKHKLELPPTSEYEPLRQTITTIDKTLQSSGLLTKDQRELITYRIVIAMLENPHGTLNFIQQATKKG